MSFSQGVAAFATQVYSNGPFYRLITYNGSKPWTGDAVAEYMDLYDDAEGIAPEQLDDGWLFTASGGAGAHVVMARRLVAGTVYSVSASLDTEERQEAAVLFAKSLRHG